MSDCTSEQEQKKIHLHFAKKILDQNAFVYNTNVLKEISVDLIVRISFEVNFEQYTVWHHDAPYCKIITKNQDNTLLGEIQDINRRSKDNNYPLNIGEKIWFKAENIIEIPSDINSKILTKFITDEKVNCTGPLYTIQSDWSDTDSESNSGSNSNSESNLGSSESNESYSDSD